MKKLYFLFFLFSVFCFSQIQVDYHQTFNMHVEDAAKNESTQKMIEHFKIPVPFTLKISNNTALYEEVAKINNSQQEAEIYMVGGSENPKVFTDYNQRKQIEELGIEGRKYLVTDSILNYNWKIFSKQSEELNGYNVRYATLELDENVFIEAWYSTELPFKFGPNLFGGLPGLILKMRTSYKDQPGNYQLIEAVKITKNENLKIKIPEKGKVISRDEFKELMSEYSKRVKEMIVEDCTGDCD